MSSLLYFVNFNINFNVNFAVIGKGWSNIANSVVLQVRERESMERFQQKIYAVQEVMDQMRLEETTQKTRLQEWVGHVKETLK